jgi:hypothetical protein
MTATTLRRILDADGLDDAIWACRTLDAADLPRLAEFARRVAARVAHLRSVASAAAVYYAAEADRAATAGYTAIDAATATGWAGIAAIQAGLAADAAAEAADAWHVERRAQAEIFCAVFA